MSEENTEITNESVETPQTETPAAPAAPQPGTDEYNARMAAEGSVALGQVPDKFKNEDGTVNMEAFTKSYLEMEKQFHTSTETAPEEEVVEKETTSDGPDALVDELRVPDVPEPEKVEEKAEAVGITRDDLSDMTTEIMRSGSISDEQRASLNQRGVHDSVIDAVVEGQRAQMRQQYSVAADVVGGSDRLSKIFGWAAHNLDDSQRAQINAGLASNASEITLRGLASMYDQAAAQTKTSNEMKTTSKPMQSPAGREVVSGYSTKAEYYKAAEELQRNPNDRRLRSAIEERMIKTDWSTIR